MKLNWIVAFVCLASTLGDVWSLSCKDDDGNDVDWWYLYKLPNDTSQWYPNVATGYAYTYIVSSIDAFNWILSSKFINDSNSMVGRSLSPMYSTSSSSYMYALYNDEHPDDTTTSTYGHTKGIFLSDSNQGLWMIHSTPKFPPDTSGSYSYPDTGTTYGQTFFCVTVDTAVANTIGLQFQYNLPWLYDSNMPSWAQSVAPNLYDYVVNGVQVSSAPWSHVVSFNSSGGQSFRSFAKHTNYGLDLYYDLVAPDLQIDLYVESWNHGSDNLPSNCTGYAVYNIMAVSNSAVGYSFSTRDDNSKWAADSSGSFWVCVGDIDRTASQEKRGGGTVCTIDYRPWNSFKSSVFDLQPC